MQQSGNRLELADRINGTTKKKPRPLEATGAFELEETEVRNQYPQTLTVRQRKPNGVSTRRVTKHPSPP
jgi:hypothetical protein